MPASAKTELSKNIRRAPAEVKLKLATSHWRARVSRFRMLSYQAFRWANIDQFQLHGASTVPLVHL